MGMLYNVEEAWKEKILYNQLKNEWHMHSVDDLVACLGEFSGHVSRHIDGFDAVHGGCDVGQCSLDLERY